MSQHREKDEQEFWYSGKVTRRRFVGWGGIAAATIAVPAPWRNAFGAETPLKIGSLQPLTGPAAPGGATAIVGLRMAVDRINKAGGINGRPVDLILADTQSKPDQGRRQAQKLVEEDQVDVSCGGFLSNVCLACMPLWAEHKIVNMISVCLDTTITGSNCNKYTFRPFDAAPAQAVAFGPELVKLGKKWHIVYADYSWGQSTRDAYAAAIAKHGGEVAGTTGIPIGTADMTPFLSKISGNFDGLFGIFFGKDGVTLGTQAYDLGLTKKYKFAGDGAIAVPSNLPALGQKIDGFYGIDRYIPVFEGPLDTPYNRHFFAEAAKRLKTVAPQAPVPDRYVQSNYEAMNALKLGMEKSHFRGREDSDKLVAALEGMHVKAGPDFPQGDLFLRKTDHQAFINEFIYQIRDGKYHLIEWVAGEKTEYPSMCTMPA